MYEMTKPFSVASLPIIRIYKRRGSIIGLAITSLLFSPIAVMAILDDAKTGHFFNESTISSIVLSGWPLVFLLYVLPLGGSKLVIDESGVHQTLGQKSCEFLWRDIVRANIIERWAGGGRGKLYKAKKIQIVTRDNPNPGSKENIISPIFAIRADDLDVIIRAGIDRWSRAQAANLD